jgi:hypothetical protein
MVMRRFMAAALWSISAVACAGNSEGQGKNLPPLGDTFNCTDPIDVLQELPDSYATVADVIALPVSGDQGRGHTGPDNDVGSRRAFSKVGLLVRPATTFQIHVAPSSQRNALIQWGNVEANEPVSSIAVSSCPGDRNTWLVYPGGVWTLEPACVELTILTTKATETVRLAAGAECI